EIAGRFVSTGGLTIPDTALSVTGEEIPFSQLFLESLSATRELHEGEEAVMADGGRRSKKRFAGLREEIESLDEPINLGVEDVTLTCEIQVTGSKEMLTVKVRGFAALLIHRRAVEGQRVELTGTTKGGVLEASTIVLLRVEGSTAGQTGKPATVSDANGSEQVPEQDDAGLSEEAAAGSGE
ncbi:MAG TPA: hypothetical protein VIC05_03075, partial [Solirubrobacteraceae bacterium]